MSRNGQPWICQAFGAPARQGPEHSCRRRKSRLPAAGSSGWRARLQVAAAGSQPRACKWRPTGRGAGECARKLRIRCTLARKQAHLGRQRLGRKASLKSCALSRPAAALSRPAAGGYPSAPARPGTSRSGLSDLNRPGPIAIRHRTRVRCAGRAAPCAARPRGALWASDRRRGVGLRRGRRAPSQALTGDDRLQRAQTDGSRKLAVTASRHGAHGRLARQGRALCRFEFEATAPFHRARRRPRRLAVTASRHGARGRPAQRGRAATRTRSSAPPRLVRCFGRSALGGAAPAPGLEPRPPARLWAPAEPADRTGFTGIRPQE